MIELIAEISTGHGGSMALAEEFIWRFVEAGATFIKFQHTRVAHLRRDDPQWDWFARSELSLAQVAHLKEITEHHAGAKFLTTVYHHDDVPEVASLGLEAIKIGSGEAREQGLAAAIRATPIPRVIIGLGLCHQDPDGTAWLQQEVRANSVYQPILERSPQTAVFLGCLTRYPAPLGWAREIVAPHGYPRVGVGWSDHSIGLGECQSAILAGATVIECHVQLPNQARPPKAFEKTVEEFTALRQFADEDPQRFIGRWQAQ